METIKARFVGGPKHNEVIECSRLPIIHVFPKIEICSYEDIGKIMPETIVTTEYRLFRFVSEGGAKFTQYIHETMIENGEPMRQTFADPESWPKLPSEMSYYFEMKILKAVIRSHC